ncbi:MAG: carbon-nitrogen family hydrolase [Firmicutes bacterium]|nr:carbon-nitrogen family hydrolase [Bacillota bacterium]
MTVKVASIQHCINDNHTKEERLDQVSKLIDEVSEFDLILLPEMWNVGFLSFGKYESYAETLDGPTISMISEKAKKHNAYIMGGTIVEKDGAKKYNTAVLVGPDGKIAATYRKIHLVTRKGAAEVDFLEPGTDHVTVETELGVIGFGICYDLRFPELYRRMAIYDNAEIFLQPAAWPLQRVENWIDLMHARANENQAYLISCNACGTNEGVQNFGHSAIVDPHGISIASGGLTQCIVKGEIDLEELRKFRQNTPHLKTRVLTF